MGLFEANAPHLDRQHLDCRRRAQEWVSEDTHERRVEHDDERAEDGHQRHVEHVVDVAAERARAAAWCALR